MKAFTFMPVGGNFEFIPVLVDDQGNCRGGHLELKIDPHFLDFSNVKNVDDLSSTLTNDPNTTFFTNPPKGIFTSKNVWCALAKDRNTEFPIYGQYCNPCDNVCVRATVHVHVNR